MKKMPVLVLLALASTSVLASGTHDHSHDNGKVEFGVGKPVQGKPDRVIGVSMHDTMRYEFEPEFHELRAGEVIRFEVRNDGRIVHEFSIGNAAEQKKHAEMMRKMPDMKHNDPNTVSLEPGESTTLTWRFDGDDTVVFACNEPGHFEAGMHHSLDIELADNSD
ncbi:MAG TPA: cupredoxin family protein [Gammaproteobacteria bacterium]|nr:cupredoxin family protein [Gammaproteobacteria bacterium]